MDKISEITKYLFDCDYFAEDFDADDSYEHYDCAHKQMEDNMWSDVYNSWFQYLIDNCESPEKVINFVNLFSYYGGQDQAIKNPYEFLGYIYCKVDMDKYWDVAGDLFDSVAISILESCGKINTVKNPYYNPIKDPEIIASSQKWKDKLNGLY